VVVPVVVVVPAVARVQEVRAALKVTANYSSFKGLWYI